MKHLLTDTLVVAQRNLRRIVRTPQLLVFSSIQPIMFVLLFRYVFGGAIQPWGYANRYADYLLPGIMVQLTLFGGSSTAVGLAEDFNKGIIDRFRSLPMSRGAVLAGRTIADIARSLFVILLVVGVGYLVGFRFSNGFLPAVAAIGITLLFGFAFSWFFALIGIAVKDAETAQVAGFLPIFPLVFAASTFAGVETMPGWLQAFAKVNPVTNAVNAVRALSHGSNPLLRFQEQVASGGKGLPPGFDVEGTTKILERQADTGRYVLYTLLWCAAIIAVFGTLAISKYRKGR